MRAQIIQTRTGSDAVYRIQRGTETVWEAVTSLSPVQVHTVLRQDDQEVYTIHGGSGLFRQEVRCLVDADERAMKICMIYSPQGQQVGFVRYALGRWRDIPSFRLDLQGRRWTGYQVGLGRQGIKFPIYDQWNRQTALLEREPVMRNGQDFYQLSALDDESALTAVLLGLYYDWEAFMRGQNGGRKSQVTVINTLNRRQKEKYDPMFSPQCPL